MRQGFSTSRRCEDKAACLKGNQVDFVVRYHSARTTNPGKRLSPPEAAAFAQGWAEACHRLPRSRSRTRGLW